MHYCLCTDCTDCTDSCGGAMAVVEKNSFKITSGEDKIHNLDTKPPATGSFARIAAATCFLFVDAFPDFVLIHVPTLDRHADLGAKPDRWVFTDSKLPMLTIPDDGLPRHPGWAGTAHPNY